MNDIRKTNDNSLMPFGIQLSNSRGKQKNFKITKFLPSFLWL